MMFSGYGSGNYCENYPYYFEAYTTGYCFSDSSYYGSGSKKGEENIIIFTVHVQIKTRRRGPEGDDTSRLVATHKVDVC
jgi:hypothetical protein